MVHLSIALSHPPSRFDGLEVYTVLTGGIFIATLHCRSHRRAEASHKRDIEEVDDGENRGG